MWILFACSTPVPLASYVLDEGYAVPPPPGQRTLVVRDLPGVHREGTPLSLLGADGTLRGSGDIVLDDGADVFLYVPEALAAELLSEGNVWLRE